MPHFKTDKPDEVERKARRILEVQNYELRGNFGRIGLHNLETL